ncbi:conserved hypothetical protein [Ricinus communis]|uniref:SAM domain-containing protein n=1 Tax=Ricinus communis TaxID=3988 RepID=B9SZM8_RICCO|nr:conserved hypothetical protein [Ricinus communis]|eukprot:XP_002531447.1 uncharacterized protein LOC8286595 [Ricinus communis]
MDWFSWLSRSSLEPSLIYEYGLAFARNELQAEDLTYFNHEFLQSMGISVAKHRLEILKLARKEAGAGTTSLCKLKNAINKTKKSIRKCIGKLVFHDQESVFKALPEPVRNKEQRRGGLTRNYKSDKEFQVEKLQPQVIKTRRQAKSGPLDGRIPENLMQNPRVLKLSGPLDGRVPENLMLNNSRNNLRLSGPLDGKVHDRLVFAYRSPKLYGSSDGRVQQKSTGGGRSPRVPRPLDSNKERMIPDDFDDQSLWSELFQDMKPT